MEYFPCGSKTIVLYDIHRVMLDNLYNSVIQNARYCQSFP